MTPPRYAHSPLSKAPVYSETERAAVKAQYEAQRKVSLLKHAIKTALQDRDWSVLKDLPEIKEQI